MARMLPFLIVIIASSLYFIMKSDFKPEEAISGKNILVTGASSGVGEELAYRYAQLKANLILTARREKELKEIAEKCRQLGAPKVEIVVADMAKPEDRAHLIKQTEKTMGNNLDYLIINHAIFPVNFWTGTNENMTFLQRTLDVNFVSYVDLASKGVELLKKNKGHIGVVSAGCGKLLGCPRLAAYSASKSALHGFFSAWRQELIFHQIPVSITLCVLGLIDTETSMSQIGARQLPVDPKTMAASAISTADAIVESVARKQYQMFYPFYLGFADKLHAFFNDFTENYGGRFFLKGLEN